MTKIEQLESKTSQIKDDLNKLKNDVNLSEEQKREKAQEIFTGAKDIELKINELESQTWEGSQRDTDRAKLLLKNFEEVKTLYNDIMWEETRNQNLNQNNTNQIEDKDQTTNTPTSEVQNEDKSILWTIGNWFWSAKEWIWNQWSDIWNTDKRKEDWLKNWLRTAWFLWAAGFIYEWAKSLWNWAFWDDEEEHEEKTESKKKKSGDKRYSKLLKWAGITTAAWGWIYFLGKHFNLWWNDTSIESQKPESSTETQIEPTSENKNNNQEEKPQTDKTSEKPTTWEQKTAEQKNNNQKENLQVSNSWYTTWEDLTKKQQNIMGQKLNKINSPITVKMVQDSCSTHNVPVEYLLGFMQNDSSLWTKWKWAKTHNPWNVWNTDSWGTKDFWTREKWVDACAENLEKRIVAYSKAKKEHNWKWFNDFPTPKELATWKSEGWTKFFGVYMTSKTWPTNVTKIINSRADSLS